MYMVSELMAEFMQAHKPVITQITAGIEHGLQTSSDIAHIRVDNGDGHFVTGEARPEDFSDDDPEVAARRSDRSNNRTLFIAETHASIHLIRQVLGAELDMIDAIGHEPNDEELTELPDLWPAEYHSEWYNCVYGLDSLDEYDRVISTRSIELTRLAMRATGFAPTEELQIVIEDIDTKDALRIQRTNGVNETLSHSFRPAEDLFIDHCIEVFGEGIIDFIPMVKKAIVGQFADVEELDAILQVVWKEFKGSSREDELKRLLQHARSVGIAQQDIQKFEIIHNSRLPSREKLEEFAEIATLF